MRDRLPEWLENWIALIFFISCILGVVEMLFLTCFCQNDVTGEALGHFWVQISTNISLVYCPPPSGCQISQIVSILKFICERRHTLFSPHNGENKGEFRWCQGKGEKEMGNLLQVDFPAILFCSGPARNHDKGHRWVDEVHTHPVWH